jgi:DNA-binding HxlR family transcriptional regulator
MYYMDMTDNIEIVKTATTERCPVEAVAEIIGQKWVALIIRDLASGPCRFGVLQQSLNIRPRVLSSKLQELEAASLVNRKIFAEIPPHTEYTLTERGMLLVPVIVEMRRIGKNFV